MNDISVKVVESLKEPPQAAVSPSELAAGDNEVDPLAIDDVVGAVIKPLVEAEVTNENTDQDNGNCDENAKEKKSTNNEDCKSEKCGALETEEIKEELLKEDTNSLDDVENADVKKIKEEEIAPSIEQNEPAAEIVPLDPDPAPAEDVVKDTIQAIEKHTAPSPTSTPKPEEPSPPKEVPVAIAASSKVDMKVEPDVEMTEVEKKPELKGETKSKTQAINGDVGKANHKEEKSTKRRVSLDIEAESPLKKLCQEVEKTFPQHDFMINDYIQTATKNNVDEIQRHTEQLLSEIQTLRELAQKKEQEWNNILHLKKVKEEILLRLLRRKQVLSFEKAADVNGSERTDPFDYLNQAKNLAIDKSDEISGLAIKQPPSAMNPMMSAPVMPITSHYNPMSGLPPPYDKAHMQNIMPKPVYPQPLMMPGPMPVYPRDMNGQLSAAYNLPMGRQGPTKDVKSIIADYRQRNPDLTPRRGRRMKSILNPNMMTPPRPIAPKMDGMNSMNSLNNLNMLFNNLDMNQKAMLERLQQIQSGGLPNGLSFKDVLVQFANMQQNAGLIPPPRPEPRPRRLPHEEMPKPPERRPSPNPRLPPPPPYPEISLLPVTTSQETSQQNSLLHGILTKQATAASQSYSPTLAKLLTSPERKQSAPALPTFGQAKNCGEITITPVQPSPAQTDTSAEKPEEVVQLDDEESPASEGSGAASPGGSGSGSGSGRLVIDEGGAEAGAEPQPEAGASAEAEAEADAPLCQGCRRRDAQFVCAGCANQWYCSRDCQVAAWDEHSEMCSG